MDKQPIIKTSNHKSGVASYVIGFGLSLVTTLAAYSLVRLHVNTGHITFSDQFLLIILAALAITQLFVQLIFFLHMNRETKPRLNALLLLFAGLVVLVIVGGSIWIMSNLNYHMPANQTDNFIIKDEVVHH